MMLTQYEYHQALSKSLSKVQALPPGEVNYYLALLLHSLKGDPPEKAASLLIPIDRLIDSILQLYQPDTSISQAVLLIWQNFSELQKLAQTHTLSRQIKNHLITLGSCLSALILGCIGGIIGGLVGFIRGCIHIAPFKGLGVGLFTGYFIGATIGFRAPKKLCKDELLRQLKNCLDSIHDSLTNIQKSYEHGKEKPFNEYLEQEKKRVRLTYFNSDTEFEEYLNSDITYTVNAYQAGFIGGEMLHGYVGNHGFIIVPINKGKEVLEFNLDVSNPEEVTDNQEKRTVKGMKILEMLALHKKLQETNPCNAAYILTQMKPGEKDCWSYINKILVGTSQQASKFSRYQDQNVIGRTIGFFFNKLSPFRLEPLDNKQILSNI